MLRFWSQIKLGCLALIVSTPLFFTGCGGGEGVDVKLSPKDDETLNPETDSTMLVDDQEVEEFDDPTTVSTP